MRVVMEKPFGRDTASASALAEAVDGHLRPEEVCKVDHYLGKAAVNDIASFRGANRGTYEPLLSYRFVEEIEVVMQETEDCEGRTAFFERYGIVRDVLQNHLSEMLGLATGELEPAAPGLTGADLVNRTALLVDVPAPRMQEATFGQYAGYKQHVAEDGGTEADAPTAAVVNLKIESARWAGVPITMRVGKALDTREAFLRIVFKQDRFPKVPGQAADRAPPELRFQIQGGAAGAMISVSPVLPMPNWPAGWDPVASAGGDPRMEQRSAVLVATPPPAYHVLMRAAVGVLSGSSSSGLQSPLPLPPAPCTMWSRCERG
jgi:hexose-6-phosphate dehydrogenase